MARVPRMRAFAHFLDSPPATRHRPASTMLAIQRSRHPATVIAVSLALTMPACGGGESDSATEATTSTTGTTTGTTGTTGASSPTTGTSAAPTTGDTTTDGPTTGDTTTAPTTGDITGTSTTTGGSEASFSFFVSSVGSPTANLGGLAGADQRCQELAAEVGAGGRTWRAYLSAEDGGDGNPVHARDRIGQGPWYNVDLILIAADLDELHTKDGDPELFLDEHGEMVPGQWEGSPDPNVHDILTGSNKDGTVYPGRTCADWTSEDPNLFAQVGHSDGLGPGGSDAEQYRSWNSVHENGGCHDTAPKGGGGRIYCFAVD